MYSNRLGCPAVLAAPLLLMLSSHSAFAARLLRYTIRFEPFEVELTLPNGVKQKKSLPRQPSYFYHRADYRWPLPDGPADERVRCEIQWVGIPQDWRLVSSWSIDRRVEKVETTLRGLRKAVFVGGDFRTARSEKGLMLVTRGAWSFSDASLLTLMDRIAEFHTAVWQDRGVAGHRIFLAPSERSWGGEGRTNSLIMEGSPETYDAREFARLLAHELFHEWNPRRLNYPDDETLYWFTEGFTEYYAVACVWRAGIWTFDQVLDHFNRQARAYFGSSARNLTPSRMVELRQSDKAANQLPYQQGYLLAAHWNSGGKTLDVAMRNLLRDNREPLSNARIVKALRSIGIGKAEEEIQRFVVEGKTIELRANLWGNCATETRTEVRTFDMGFDLTQSNRTKIIHGAKQESNAWRAGVRDGQKWTPTDVVWGDSSYSAEIEVEDGQGKRRIRYYPASTDIHMVPQYKANPGRCDPGTLSTLPAAR